MGRYDEYLRRKAFLDFYSRLSDEDKRLLAQTFSPVKNDIMGKLDDIEKKVDLSRHSFGRGVLENITGNAAYDLVLYLAKGILNGLR